MPVEGFEVLKVNDTSGIRIGIRAVGQKLRGLKSPYFHLVWRAQRDSNSRHTDS